MSDFNFKKQCINCNNDTLNRCIKCGRPLCNRCKSRKNISIPFSNNIIPKGVCQECKKELLTKGALLSAAAFHDLLKDQINKFD